MLWSNVDLWANIIRRLQLRFQPSKPDSVPVIQRIQPVYPVELGTKVIGSIAISGNAFNSYILGTIAAHKKWTISRLYKETTVGTCTITFGAGTEDHLLAPANTTFCNNVSIERAAGETPINIVVYAGNAADSDIACALSYIEEDWT